MERSKRLTLRRAVVVLIGSALASCQEVRPPPAPRSTLRVEVTNEDSSSFSLSYAGVYTPRGFESSSYDGATTRVTLYPRNYSLNRLPIVDTAGNMFHVSPSTIARMEALGHRSMGSAIILGGGARITLQDGVVVDGVILDAIDESTLEFFKRPVRNISSYSGVATLDDVERVDATSGGKQWTITMRDKSIVSISEPSFEVHGGSQGDYVQASVLNIGPPPKGQCHASDLSAIALEQIAEIVRVKQKGRCKDTDLFRVKSIEGDELVVGELPNGIDYVVIGRRVSATVS